MYKTYAFENHVQHKKEHFSETKTRYTCTKCALHKAKFKGLDCTSFWVLAFITYHCFIPYYFRLCITRLFLKIHMYTHFINAINLSFHYYESICYSPLKNIIIHVYVYFVTYLYSTHILAFYRAKKLCYGLALIAIIPECIGCLFIYTLVYYTHYSFFYTVNYHRLVNLQFNSWHFCFLIKRVILYLLTQIMSSNYLYKWRYVSTLFINCCLYLQLMLVWSDCLTKLKTRSLWVAFRRRVFLVCSVHTVQNVLLIITCFVFSFTVNNTSTFEKHIKKIISHLEK